MAESFSRTLRSLRTESVLPPIVALGVGLSLLGLWLAWFALASLDERLSSTAVQWMDPIEVRAQFEPADFARLRLGQRAWLQSASRERLAGTACIAARLVALEPARNQALFQLHIQRPVSQRTPNALRIQVIVAQYTPLHWLLHQGGLL